MAIVVEVGGGDYSAAAGIAGALKGYADFKRGKQAAIDEEDERQRRKAEEERSVAAHNADQAKLAQTMKVVEAESDRDKEEWERLSGEGGKWDQEDADLKAERGRREGDRKWTEMTRREQAREWKQEDEDRARKRRREDLNDEWHVTQRGWDERRGEAQVEADVEQLNRVAKTLRQFSNAEEGQQRNFHKSLENSALSLRYSSEDWDYINEQLRVGGLDAGHAAAKHVNGLVLSKMDDEASAKLQSDPTGVSTGALDLALANGTISEDNYETAQQALATWGKLTPLQREEARKKGTVMSPDALLVGLRARRKAKRAPKSGANRSNRRKLCMKQPSRR